MVRREAGLPAVTKPKLLITSGTIWKLVLVLFSVAIGIGLAFAPPLIVAALAGVVFYLFLLYYYPYLGILAYLVVEYARLQTMYPVLISLQLGKVVVLATLLMWGFHLISSRRWQFCSERLNWIMLLWLLVIGLSAAFASNTKVALAGFTDFSRYLVIYFLIVNLVDSAPKFQGFIWVLLLLNLKLSQHQIRAYLAGYEMTGGSAEFVQRGVSAGSGFFGNAGDFSVAMVVVAPLAIYLLKSVKSVYLKLLSFAMLIAFIVSIMRGGTRGAALALFLVALVYWLKSKHKLVGVLLLALFIFVYWAATPESLKQRYVSGTRFGQDPTATFRLSLWKAGLKMFIDHPILGVGINNFPDQYAQNYLPEGQESAFWAPHNIFVQALSETGILGFLCLLATLFLIYKNNHESRKILEEGNPKNQTLINMLHALDISLVGFIVSGSFLTVLYYPHLYIIMSLSVCLSQIAKKRGGEIQVVQKSYNV